MHRATITCCALRWHSQRIPNIAAAVECPIYGPRERHSAPRRARSFLTCHRRSKFHSSCAALALISCETLRLPPWVHRFLHSRRIRCRRAPGHIFHVDHDLRVPVDRPKTHAVIAIHALLSGPPTSAIIVMYASSLKCHVGFCRDFPRNL